MAEHEVSIGLPKKLAMPFFRYADTTGDGSGSINFVGNYSSSAEQAIMAAGPSETLVVARLIVMIEDSTGMRAERYATLGAALTNGVAVRHYAADGTTILNNLTGAVPITTNALWGSTCYDVDLKEWGAGNELLLVRWTFWKAGTPGIQLLPSESIRVDLSDNFTGVVQHCFQFQGFSRSAEH